MLHAKHCIRILIAATMMMAGSAVGAESTQDLQEHLSIPIRWCAMQGSPAVKNTSAAKRISTDEVLRGRHTRATVFVWMPRSGVSFRSALTNDMQNRSGFPLIKDPHPPAEDGSGGPGSEGDILSPYLDQNKPSELNTVIANCEKAWEQLEDQFETNFEGIIGVNIRRFVRPDGTPSDLLGIGTSIHTSPHGIDKCEVPANLASYDPLLSNDGWVAVVDNHFTKDSDPYDSVLAHELGHVLFLGHGNGVDDPAGNPPRKNERFDEFCDRHEDANAPPSTLMRPSSPVPDHLTKLQRTSARAVARVTVGGIILQTGEQESGYVISDEEVDTVGEVRDPSVDLRTLGIQYNTVRGVTLLDFRLVGQLPPNPNHRFLVFADLDTNPQTGGDLAAIGFQTSFKGAEFVIEVVVAQQENESPPSVTPTVWIYRSGNFVKITPDPKIKAHINTAVFGHTRKAVHDVVSIQLPQGLVEPRPVKVRFQAVAERMGGEQDRLPDKEGHGRLIRLIKPVYPLCRAIPDAIKPGHPIRIEASGFVPHRNAKIFIDHTQIGDGLINDNGTLRVNFLIPKNTKDGLHLLVVTEEGKAIAAHCALNIERDNNEQHSTAESVP